MTDGMAPENLPDDVVGAIDAVMEKSGELSRVLDARGYDAGTALFDIARDELIDSLRAEREADDDTDRGAVPC